MYIYVPVLRVIFFPIRHMFKNHHLARSFKIDGYESYNSSKREVLFTEESTGLGSFYYSMTTG